MFCNRVKEFLSQRGIPFRDKNILEDSVALDELQKLGYMTTPVTVIDGEVIIGFDQAKLESLLK
jgi:thioredoxin reductase (NADPH)